MLSTRRSFLGKFSAFVGAVVVPVVWSRSGSKGSPKDVHADGRPMRMTVGDVFSDGVEKIYCKGKELENCFEVHRSEKWAKCYLFDGGHAKIEVVHGRIDVAWKKLDARLV